MSVYVCGQFKTHTEKIMKYSKITTDFEIVTLVIKKPIFRNMIVMTVYKPPTGKIENCIKFLTEILSDPLVTKCETWILGDFNVDILRQDDNKVIALQEFVQKNGLFQKINTIFRPNKNGRRCIALIMTNCPFVKSREKNECILKTV